MDTDPEAENRGPIPPALFSEETGESFERCVECGQPLTEGSSPYMIQKCSNGRETVFEFALCLPCAEELQSRYSDASKQAITQFFGERSDPAGRVRRLFSEPGPPSLERWTETCFACGEAPEEGEGFSIAALCDGPDLIYTHAPLLICARCEAELNEQLSPETRGEWDRFIERNFDTPPSGAILPERPKLVIV